MFRLSDYLQSLPVLPLSTQRHSRYKLRKAPDEFHLCTVEVAVELLQQHAQGVAAQALDDYFSIFNELYAQSRRQQKASLPS
jgi:DTW domain-containing protein YfiP